MTVSFVCICMHAMHDARWPVFFPIVGNVIIVYVHCAQEESAWSISGQKDTVAKRLCRPYVVVQVVEIGAMYLCM